MNRTICLFLGSAMLCALAGCSTVTASPDVIVTPASAPTEKWAIGGNFDWTTGSTGNVTLYVDGTQVAALHDTSDGPTTAHGTYKSHPVQLVCPASNPSHPWCQVYIDGVETATLVF